MYIYTIYLYLCEMEKKGSYKKIEYLYTCYNYLKKMHIISGNILYIIHI